jgi:hypothetical protein
MPVSTHYIHTLHIHMHSELRTTHTHTIAYDPSAMCFCGPSVLYVAVSAQVILVNRRI